MLMNSNLGRGDDQKITVGLQALGLTAAPFLHLNANNDSRLGEYLVDFDLPPTILHDTNTAFWAAPGCGKSALRIFVMQNCWGQLGIAHPLPVFVTPEASILFERTTPDQLLTYIIKTTINSLFVGLLYQPSRFLTLQETEQIYLATLFNHCLPATPLYYLAHLRDAVPVVDVAMTIVPAYRVADVPTLKQLAAFDAALTFALQAAQLVQSKERMMEIELEQLLALICGRLGFRSVFLLIDGLDGFLENIRNPAYTAEWLLQLERQVAEYPQLKLKAFLPEELATAFVKIKKDISLSSSEQVYHLTWTTARLCDLIHQRITVASQGQFDSFDAVSASGLRNIEELIVEGVPKQPREVLILLRQLILEYWQRAGPQPRWLESQDLERALRWYHAHQGLSAT